DRPARTRVGDLRRDPGAPGVVEDRMSDDERERAARVVERELRGDDAAERASSDDRARDAERVEEAGEVTREIRRGPVARRARRAAGAASVVGEHAVPLRELRRRQEKPRWVVVRLELARPPTD